MYQKKMFAVCDIVPKSSSRPELGGVCVERDRLTATDSYVALQIKNNEVFPASDFPSVNGMVPIEVMEPIIVRLETVDEIRKSMKSNSLIPNLNHACVIKGNGNEFSIATTDLDETVVRSSLPIGGNYPLENIDRLVNKDSDRKPTVSVNVNLEYLLKVLNAMKKFKTGDFNKEITIDIWKETKKDGRNPIRIKTESGKLEAVGLVMPIVH